MTQPAREYPWHNAPCRNPVRRPDGTACKGKLIYRSGRRTKESMVRYLVCNRCRWRPLRRGILFPADQIPTRTTGASP